MEHVPGRSINLALSQRGKCALEAVGLKDYIVEQGVALYARLVHNIDGKTFSRQPYGQPGEHIVSINRRHLNEVLISQAESSKKVRFFFEHKVTAIDLEKKEMSVAFIGGSKIPKPGQSGSSVKNADVIVKADLVVACDGAYSAVRRSLATQPRFDYSQEYIGHGYIELNILPKNGEYALEPDVFHLWPRGQLTLIALANRDKTFTVTLFAPFSEFERHMSTSDDVDSFFRQNFPDAYELLGKDHLHDTFRRVRPQPLISIKCRPHHFAGFVLLAGDAAHAMAPFYGQGMNCGFEDCLVLKETLDACNDDIPKALEMYSENRVKDTHTIIDLAMYNYEELKDLVNHSSYKLRKKIDLFLNQLFPKTWIPRYSMVTFTRMPYHQVVEERQWQDKILSRLQLSFASIAAVLTIIGLYHVRRRGVV
ncbi:FAD-dependent monooxygenase [Trichostrongylus colubriformis]|uniref:FAD-dependent monooxygenase n=1 Tax=Trichostrongylus colubriformis TaxID=6319 RepID=A0AAN8IU85_TRICO